MSDTFLAEIYRAVSVLLHETNTLDEDCPQHLLFNTFAGNSPVVVWRVSASLRVCVKKEEKKKRRENDKLQTIMWQEIQEELF